MPNIVLGLDVGARSIKAALVRQGRRGGVLGAAILPTPDGCVADGEIAQPGMIARALRPFIDGAPVKPTALAACMNSPNIITRRVELPSIGEEETAPAVKMEILKLFPSIKGTHAIAQRATKTSEGDSEAHSVGVVARGAGVWQAMGRRGRLGSGKKVSAAFAALCPVSLVRMYEELASLLGLPLKYADVRANAIVKAISRYCIQQAPGADAHGAGSPGADVHDADIPAVDASGADAQNMDGSIGVVLDIGYDESCISVVADGMPLMSRQAQTGVEAFDRLAAAQSGASMEAVESGRLSGDFTSAGLADLDITATVGSSFGEIEEQLRQTAMFFGHEKPPRRLSYLHIVGEGAGIPGIGVMLSGALGGQVGFAGISGGQAGFAGIPDGHAGFAASSGGQAGFAASPDGSGSLARPLSQPKGWAPAMEHFIASGSWRTLLAAVGAATRATPKGRERPWQDINFSDAGEATGGAGQGKAPRLMLAAAAASLVLLAVGGAALAFTSQRQSDMRTAQAIDMKLASDTVASGLERDIAAAEQRLSDITSVSYAIDRNSVKASGIMETVTRELPENVFVVTFNAMSAWEAVMTGKSRDYGSIAGFAQRLRDSGEFYGVHINSVALDPGDGQGAPGYSFSIIIDLLGDGG